MYTDGSKCTMKLTQAGIKRIFLLLLLTCLCISLCACNGKSAEAEKADELILAIGEVTLDSEPAIIAASVYYDTLTAAQKAEVENYSLLEAAIISLNALKNEGKFEQIYEKALKYEADLRIDEAYAEYKQLPADYKDVEQRMHAIAPLVGVSGTWICDEFTAASNKGTKLGAMFKTIKITISSIEDGMVAYSCSGDWADSQYTNSSIVAGHADLLFVLDESWAWGVPEQDSGGNWILGESSAGKTGFGTLYIKYSVTAEGNLIVEYRRSNNGDTTTVAFTYSKQ